MTLKTLVLGVVAFLFVSVAGAQQIPLWPGDGSAPSNQALDEWFATTNVWCATQTQQTYSDCMQDEVYGAQWYADMTTEQWYDIVIACNSTWIWFLVPQCYYADEMLEDWGAAASYIYFELNSWWYGAP